LNHSGRFGPPSQRETDPTPRLRRYALPNEAGELAYF
jgi:hypothetical protein